MPKKKFDEWQIPDFQITTMTVVGVTFCSCNLHYETVNEPKRFRKEEDNLPWASGHDNRWYEWYLDTSY